MTPRRFILWTLLGIAGLTLLFAAFNYAVDPLQQYRVASYYKVCFKNQRYLNPGLARTYPYDTAVIGTSMTDNLTAPMIKEALGLRALALGMDGSSAHEQRLMLESALASGKVKTVLMGFDIPSFSGAPDRFKDGRVSFPFFLYDASIWNDYKYLVNFDTLKLSVTYLLHAAGLGAPCHGDVGRAYFWGDRYTYAEREVVKYFDPHTIAKRYARPEEHRQAALVRNYKVNWIPLLEKNPNVRFILFHPPYSYLFWRSCPYLDDYLGFKAQVAAHAAGLKNVELYDFQHEPLTVDLNNYKDYTHFSPAISQRLVQAMARGENRVTPAVAAANEASLRALLASTPLPGGITLARAPNGD